MRALIPRSLGSLRVWHLAVCGILILLVDRLAKIEALNSLVGRPYGVSVGPLSVSLELHLNKGSFLSIGSTLSEDARTLIFGAGVFVVILVAMVLALKRRTTDAVEAMAFILIASGGLSNLIDRVLFGGQVIDFVLLSIGPIHTGVFNLADVAITAGAGLLLARQFRTVKPAPR